jgi:hypothetical protein
MPHGRRSERINERDLEALRFVARFGTVPRSVLATRLGSGRTVSFERERRLRLAGLLAVRRGPDDHDRLLNATRLGIRACARLDLRVARPSPATVGHEVVVARLGARLELDGELVLSEREILARERAEGRRIYSASLGHGRFHRADLIRLGDDGAEAIEVELSVKGAARLDALLRAWRFAVAERRVTGVVYHCIPRTRRFVEQSIARTATGEMIEVVDLRV